MIAAEEERRYEDDRRALDSQFASIVDKESIQKILNGSSSSDPDRQRAYQILLEQIMPAHWKAAVNRAEVIPDMSVRAAKGIVEAAKAEAFSDRAWAEIVRIYARIARTAGIE